MEFQEFRKIPRLSRDMVITEKIDGTNGQIAIFSYNTLLSAFQFNISGNLCTEVEEFNMKHCLCQKNNLYLFVGSKSRWLDTSSKGDNFGFAKWVQSNAEELLKLGEGRHFGEWYGKGIQRNYGLEEKRFALFNVGKWVNEFDSSRTIENDKQKFCPHCCEVVPILYQGMFDTDMIGNTLMTLKEYGSRAVPGYMNPEGAIIFHSASGQLFKKTLENDEKPKGVKNDS